jgi:hypothetical protein
VVSDHILDAFVMPLKDKHYGTQICLVLDNKETYHLNIWISGDDPSDEALQEWGVDREGYEANVEVDNGWEGTVPIQSIFPCDSHYQSQYELEVCQQIVDALTKVVRGD